MSCNRCSIDHDRNDCPREISFETEESILYGRCGAVPIRPVDLEPIVKYSETKTSLSLDVEDKYLRYTSEDGIDSIAVPDIASLIGIEDLEGVNIQVSTDGDILAFIDGAWVSYTVPSGTLVTPVGIDGDGRLVKDGTGGTSPAPDTVPLGAGLEWYGEISDIPGSFKLANGQAISRSVYSDLFTLYGTKYGAGDGSTTFNLPNRNGRVAVGYDPNDTQFDVIGQTGGAKTHTLTISQMPIHNHSRGTIYTGGSPANPGNRISSPDSGVFYTNGGSGYTGDNAGTGDRGGNSAHNNLQPYMAIPIIIRVI